MECYLTWNPSHGANVKAVISFPTPLILNQPHEIALSEVSVTKFFKNSPPTGVLQLVRGEKRESITFPFKYYKEVEDVFQELKEILRVKGFKDEIVLSLGNDKSSIKVVVKDNTVAFRLSSNLKAFLGGSTWNCFVPEGKEKAEFVFYPTVKDDFRSIFMECSLISPNQYIWDTNKSILGYFPLIDYDDICNRIYEIPTYHVINENRVSKIEISFLNEKGRAVMSNSGSAWVKVYIRPCI